MHRATQNVRKREEVAGGLHLCQRGGDEVKRTYQLVQWASVNLLTFLLEKNEKQRLSRFLRFTRSPVVFL